MKLSKSNALENQETVYGNYILLDINIQNNITTIPGHIEVQNNITAILGCAKSNLVDINYKLKESLKFVY